MIILDATTKSLEFKMTAAPATTQPSFVSSYVDMSTTDFSLTGATEQDGAGNGTTVVTLVSAPGASTSRKLNYLSIRNRDTAAIQITLQYNNNSTTREILKITLSVDDSLIFSDAKGFFLMDASGQEKVITPTSAAVIVAFIDNPLPYQIYS